MPIFTKTAIFTIALLTCHGCALVPAIVSTSSEASPSPSSSTIPDCLNSLPNLPIGQIRKGKSSADVEAEADELEEQGKGQEALNKYSEAHTLYFGELGRASGRALWGDYSATMKINISVNSPTFSFKVGRAFAKNGQYPPAIGCFTESLDEGISAPNDAIAYLNRGDAYERIGNKEKAKANFQQATNLFKKYRLASYKKDAEKRILSVSN